MKEPRILLFDIETSLSKGYFFDLWKEGNIVEIESSWYILCFSYKWLGQKKVESVSLPDFHLYDEDKRSDKHLVEELWELFDKADVLVAHNGDRFDIRKANARFIAHGMRPPSPYKTVDTLKIARKHFKFDSNRLDDLGAYLGVGRKKPTTGKALWLGCMSGDQKCWDQMAAYCRQDTQLLDRVHEKLRAWSPTYPDLTLFTRADGCKVCQSPELVRTGFAYTATGKRQRVTCLKCGHRATTGKLIREAA